MTGNGRGVFNPDFKFQKSPFLYVLLALALGIACQSHSLKLAPVKVLTLTLLLIILATMALWLNRPLSALLLLLAALLSLGVVCTYMKMFPRSAMHLDNYFRNGIFEDKRNPVEVFGYLYKDPEIYRDKMILYIRPEVMGYQRKAFPVSGNLRVSVYSGLYAPEDFFPGGIYYGDRIRALVDLKKVRNFLNPGSFDYAAYLKRNDIHAMASAKTPRLIERTGENVGNPILKRIYAWRRALLEGLKTHFGPGEDKINQETAILMAFLLGEQTFLSPKVEQDFKKTGVYHVLVISGQHVAAIAYILFHMLRLFRLPDWAKSLIVILVLIFYTLLVETGPSIFRSSLMIVTYLIGNMIYRERNFLNTICLAAFLLLVFNPLWLYDIGFQLTFGAVYAICLLGLPLTEFMIKPYSLGLSTVFSDVKLVEPTSLQRRARRTRFATEFFIEAMERRFPSVGRVWWVRGAKLAAMIVYNVGALFVVSLSVQLVMLVLMVGYFNQVSVFSPILNLIVVPLTTLILFITILFLPLPFISKTAAFSVAYVVKLLVKLTLIVVAHAANWRFAQYRIPTPPAWVVVGFLASLILTVLIQTRLWRRGLVIVVSIFTLLLITYPFSPKFQRGVLSVTVLDVGQGDSIFVQFPEGKSMLVDGGGLTTVGDLSDSYAPQEDDYYRRFDIGEQVVSPFLWSVGVKELDHLVLTHAHHDHISGLLSVVNNFRVGVAFDGRNPAENPEYSAFIRQLKENHIPLDHWKRDDRLEIDGVRIEVFNPVISADPPAKVSNDDSVMMKLTYKNVSVLLTGDIERKIESELVSECGRLRSRVLKVPHHGSRTSSTEDFVNCVQPDVAIISVGAENAFGHPSPSVVERYNDRGTRLYQTSIHGAVTVTTDGFTISTRTFYGPPVGKE